jgi:protein-disulfide isomerase
LIVKLKDKSFGKKMIISKRNTLLSLLAVSLLPKYSYSNQDLLDDNMRKQFMGPDNAPIKIKEYFSLTCGHCANFHVKTLPQLKEQYIDTGKVQLEFIDYPLDRLAIIAAALARTLPTKDGYLEAISILLKKQKQWAYSKKPLDELLSIAKLFGVSSKQFDQILKNISLMQQIINKMERNLKILI